MINEEKLRNASCEGVPKQSCGSQDGYESGLTSTTDSIGAVLDAFTGMGLWRTLAFLVGTALIVFLIHKAFVMAPRYFWLNIAPKLDGFIASEIIHDRQDYLLSEQGKAEIEQRRKTGVKRDKALAAQAKRDRALRAKGGMSPLPARQEFVRQPINFLEK